MAIKRYGVSELARRLREVCLRVFFDEDSWPRSRSWLPEVRGGAHSPSALLRSSIGARSRLPESRHRGDAPTLRVAVSMMVDKGAQDLLLTSPQRPAQSPLTPQSVVSSRRPRRRPSRRGSTSSLPRLRIGRYSWSRSWVSTECRSTAPFNERYLVTARNAQSVLLKDAAQGQAGP
jgi:hypothetical protein